MQSAFQSGPIRWSLPALAAANPIVSVVLGATLLHEHIRSGAFPVVGTVAGLGFVVAGIMALSSSKLIVGDPDESAALNLSGVVVPPSAVLADAPDPGEPLRLPVGTPLDSPDARPAADGALASPGAHVAAEAALGASEPGPITTSR